MEPVSLESQSKTSPSIVSPSESQRHLVSHFTTDISAGSSSEQCHQHVQKHQQLIQVHHNNQQEQQQHNLQDDIQDQDEEQPVLSQFSGQHQEQHSENKNQDIQNQHQLQQPQFHNQQFSVIDCQEKQQNHQRQFQAQFQTQQLSAIEHQEEQQKHQHDFQAQFQKQEEYQQQEFRRLKPEDQHQQLNQGHMQEQIQLLGKGQEEEQHLQLQVKQTVREKLQHDSNQPQQLELEMFSPVSQHVRNALDLYLKTKGSGESVTDKHDVPYTYRSEHQSTVSSQSHSLREMSLALAFPNVYAHLPVPVSVNESSEQMPAGVLSPLARESPQTFTKQSDAVIEPSYNETDETNIIKVTEDQHVYQSDKTAKVKETIEGSLDATIKDISHPSLLPNSTLSQAEKELGCSSSIECLKINNSDHEEILNEYSPDDKYTEKDIGMEAHNKDKEKKLEIVDYHICLCNEDFLKYSQNKSKKYICGGCLSRFVSICHLHKHLENHGSGGSYHFDHVSQTAYPKYDTFCSFTQTEDDQTRRKDQSILIEDETSISDVRSAEAIDTVHDLGDQTQGNHETEVPEQKLQPTRKCRKRKQDNPKPTKPRFVNTKKGEKSKTIRRKSDMKQKKDAYFYSTYEEFDSDHLESHTVGLVDAKTNLDTTESCIALKNNEEKQGSESTFNKQEVTLNEHESQRFTKLLRKRGRPKKTENTYEKNVAKRRKMMKKEDKVSNKRVRQKKCISIDQEEILTDVYSDVIHTKALIETADDLEDEEINIKQKVQKNETKYQMCDVCGLPVPKYNYVYHMRRHTGEKPFVCDKCGKAFAHRRFLVKHMLIHAENKPWKCNLCSAQFCQKSEYSMHMNAHEGNRPYECKVCEMKFLSKSMLNTHQANVHMGITRFECEVCHRRFFKRSSLNVHKATHFEATMKCNFCDRMFKDRAGLKRHERIHTGEKRFRCHICNHEFIQSTPYWVHMEKRHQMKRETVKNMLRDIRENNKRFGIRTEINVLPKDVDHLLKSQEETGDESEEIQNIAKSDSENSGERQTSLNSSSSGACEYQADLAFEQLNRGGNVRAQKAYTDIKVPNIYSSNVSESVTSSQYTSEIDNDTVALQQHYRYVIPEHDMTPVHNSNCQTGSTSIQERVTAGSQSLGLSANLPVSLGSMGISMGSLHHGFIGLNTLQQALDYSSSIPNTGTYTDISSDRVNNPPQ